MLSVLCVVCVLSMLCVVFIDLAFPAHLAAYNGELDHLSVCAKRGVCCVYRPGVPSPPGSVQRGAGSPESPGGEWSGQHQRARRQGVNTRTQRSMYFMLKLIRNVVLKVLRERKRECVCFWVDECL